MAFCVRKASRSVTRLYSSALDEAGLEPTQFSLLVACSRQASVTVGVLAGRLGMDRSAMGRNLAILAQRGLLRVSAGADRRLRNVAITQDGDVVLANAMTGWRGVQKTVEGEFGDARLRALLFELRNLTQATQRLQISNLCKN